jgi:hypothetical protein
MPGGGTMINKNLSRRLERLEERHAVLNNIPKFVIVAVDGDGHVSGQYRLTPTGLQRLSPEEELARPYRLTPTGLERLAPEEEHARPRQHEGK